jgi:DNA-binding NtrC family response regulator
MAPERADAATPASASLGAHRAVAEKAAIEDALQRCQGNRTQAARLLGVSRRTLYTRLSEFGLA